MEKVNNIQEVSKYFLEQMRGLIELSDFEEKIISDSILLPYMTVTNAKTVISDHIDEAVKAKSNLNYILYRLKDKRKMILLPFEAEYNKLFTVLTRQNRPSKQAIDSEIKYTRKDLAETFTKLEDYERVIEYLQSLLSVLDLVIKNAESRRYNL